MGFVIAGIILGALILFYISCFIANHFVSKNVYGRRGDSSISIKYEMPSDFKNLDIKKDYFLNNKKARLTTFEYKAKGNDNPKGILLLSHGIGGGHLYLLPLINYLCERGLIVLAYDQYGSGTSEGKRIYSMTQGAIDIKYAVRYVEAHYDLPFYVMGHSWGGFCAANSLRYSKKILKCVDIAGMDSESSMTSGPAFFATIATLFIKLCGSSIYGKYGLYTSYGAFKKTKAKVLYLQGKQDLTVPPKKNGFRYEKKFKNKENITVMMLDNKGHSPIVTYESQLGQSQVMAQFGMLCKNLVPLDVYVDFNKNNVPDMDVYKLIGDYLLD